MVDGLCNGVRDTGFDVVAEVVRRHSQPHAANIAGQGRRYSRERRRPSYADPAHLGRPLCKNNREVADTPGHGAGVIERPGKDRDACLTDASIGRLDARYAVRGRRRADRSTRVATSCSKAEARSNRSTRTTARTRRNMVLIPRILGRTGVETKGEFVGRDFAVEYCTCFGRNICGRPCSPQWERNFPEP